MTLPAGTPLPRNTDADLYLILGRIDSTTSKLDKAVNGNGKTGLIEDFRALVALLHDIADRVGVVETKLTAHILEHENASDVAKMTLASEARDAKDLLAQDVKASKEKLAEDVKTAKEKKEKFSARTWALILGVTLIVVTQLVLQVATYIQAGLAK